MDISLEDEWKQDNIAQGKAKEIAKQLIASTITSSLMTEKKKEVVEWFLWEKFCWKYFEREEDEYNACAFCFQIALEAWLTEKEWEVVEDLGNQAARQGGYFLGKALREGKAY